MTRLRNTDSFFLARTDADVDVSLARITRDLLELELQRREAVIDEFFDNEYKLELEGKAEFENATAVSCQKIAEFLLISFGTGVIEPANSAIDPRLCEKVSEFMKLNEEFRHATCSCIQKADVGCQPGSAYPEEHEAISSHFAQLKKSSQELVWAIGEYLPSSGGRASDKDEEA